MAVFIRFSLLSTGGGWRLAHSGDNYRELLFAPDRLRIRLAMLQSLTLPSLARSYEELAITCLDDPVLFDIFILTSDQLPDWARKELERIASRFDHCTFIPLPPVPAHPASAAAQIVHERLTKAAADTLMATLTVDDDDVIGRHLLSGVSQYLHDAYIGHAVSHALGLSGDFDLQTLRYRCLRQLYAPKIAIGLAFINKYSSRDRRYYDPQYENVFSLGSHVTTDEKVPVIINAASTQWIRSIHHHNDVMHGRLEHWSQYLPIATRASVEQCSDLTDLPLTKACLTKISRKQRRYRNVKSISSAAAKRRMLASSS